MSGKLYEGLADELLAAKSRSRRGLLDRAAQAIRDLETTNELLKVRLRELEGAPGCWNCESAWSCPYSPENGGVERLNCIIRPEDAQAAAEETKKEGGGRG